MAFKAGAITGDIGLNNEPAVKAIREVGAEAKAMRVDFRLSTNGIREDFQQSFTAGAGAAEKALVGIGVEARMARAEVGGLEEKMHSLRNQFGQSSGIGMAAELLQGAGVAFAATMVTRALKDATDSIFELRTEYRQGTIDGTQFVGKMTEGIPILGSFGDSLAKIATMASGSDGAGLGPWAMGAKLEDLQAEFRATQDRAEQAVIAIRDFKAAVALSEAHGRADMLSTRGLQNQIFGEFFGAEAAQRRAAGQILGDRANALDPATLTKLESEIKADIDRLAQLHFTGERVTDLDGNLIRSSFSPSANASDADIQEGNRVKIQLKTLDKTLADFKQQRDAVGMDTWLTRIMFGIEDVKKTAEGAVEPFQRLWEEAGKWGQAHEAAVHATKQEADDLKGWAASIKSAIETPLERFDEFKSKADKAKSAGFLTGEQENQALIKEAKGLLGMDAGSMMKRSGLFEVGSEQAMQARFANGIGNTRNPGEGTQQSQLDTLRAILRQLQKDAKTQDGPALPINI